MRNPFSSYEPPFSYMSIDLYLNKFNKIDFFWEYLRIASHSDSTSLYVPLS